MENYLTPEGLAHIVYRILERANDLNAEEKSLFIDGQRLAFYEVLDIIKSELYIREADLKEYGLDFELESLL